MTAADLVRPEITDLNRGFWNAAREGRLALQRCDDCGWIRYPISPVCPRCLGPSAAWTPLSGRGTLFSFEVFHQVYHEGWRDRVPYPVALVELREGPHLISRIVRAAGRPLRVGLALEAEFETIDGTDVAVPCFAPADRT